MRALCRCSLHAQLRQQEQQAMCQLFQALPPIRSIFVFLYASIITGCKEFHPTTHYRFYRTTYFRFMFSVILGLTITSPSTHYLPVHQFSSLLTPTDYQPFPSPSSHYPHCNSSFVDTSRKLFLLGIFNIR